ncbi:helix-turn-helix domain-containing protein [Pontibacter sp. G13]|uniref:winged helix-turn-helix transcriptional regulator n=1 Tax=Pontibacter sp. G13 TaxID=3074898 RepID=UPI00288BE309|nr:helix-turn-helix domain-containing protein [Pontibacter sp. G13]WNJ17125.1 helix-turn-helix domain-containing protein [Pontibacter sp. G13]
MTDIFRCNCPITSALDIVGDKWSLVIIKQMLFEEKTTFKDFVGSDEHIATNILSSRLKMLEEFGLIGKKKLPHNKKTNYYYLTDKGLSLTPILIELSLWSRDYLQEIHPNLNLHEQLSTVEKNKQEASGMIIQRYKAQLKQSESTA